MNDQAQALRNLINSRHFSTRRNSRIIAITSGKGGVGKSNFTLNFAFSLLSEGYKVLVFDADIGMANLDVLMGVRPPYNLYHLLKQEKSIWEIIYKGQKGIELIAGGSGFHELMKLNDDELNFFVEQIVQLNGYADFIIFDTGAGLSKETLRFIVSAHDAIVVTTPEPTAITDAYAIIKMVTAMNYKVNFKLVVNRVANMQEGRQTSDKITLVAKKFLNLDVSTLGYIMDDAYVPKAVKKQVPFMLEYPNCSASKNIRELAGRYLSGQSADTDASNMGGMKGFLQKMIRLMK